MDEKKLKLKLISTITLLAITFVVFTCSLVSFAWFSMNLNLSSTGMKMQAETTANLVITDDVADFAAEDYLVNAIEFEANDGIYAPATHDGATDYAATGLKYVTNESQVDIITGLQKSSGESLSYAVAENVTDGTQYYIEKEVYLASSGKNIPAAQLVGKISGATKDGTEVTSGTLMATSVDFYLKNGDTLTYKGTSNVATKAEVEILAQNTEIPLNTEGYITVVMRFYFDGALTPTGNTATAYVNTATIDLSQVSVDVAFAAIEPAA